MLAIFANGGESSPHITSCMSFKDLFAIGHSLEAIRKKTDTHTKKIATVHGQTDQCEEVALASLLTNIAEFMVVVTGVVIAMYKICDTCKRGAREPNLEALKTRKSILLGQNLGEEKEPKTDAPKTDFDTDTHFQVSRTALYIHNGVLCNTAGRTPGRSKCQQGFGDA